MCMCFFFFLAFYSEPFVTFGRFGRVLEDAHGRETVVVAVRDDHKATRGRLAFSLGFS